MPEDRVIEVSEAEAAVMFRHRGSRREIAFVAWVQDADQDDGRSDDLN